MSKYVSNENIKISLVFTQILGHVIVLFQKVFFPQTRFETSFSAFVEILYCKIVVWCIVHMMSKCAFIKR